MFFVPKIPFENYYVLWNIFPQIKTLLFAFNKQIDIFDR